MIYNAPELIQLKLLKPDDITAPGDVILFEGFYHPCSIVNVAAGEYDAPVYRPSVVEQETAA